MKKCNIPFCKEIPDTWKEVPNKYLFEYHSVKVGDNWKDYQLLSLTTGGVKEKDINASGGKVPDSYDNYQTVEPGDMIFCLFDLDVSAVFSGLSHHYGMITSAYEVVRPNPKILDQYFSDFWFQYVFTNRYYKMYSKNIRFTIGSDMFKAIGTPIPPMDQQRKIAGFLNKKTAEIDSLIEIENQQIEKLKEYKQAVITEAVTKGLDKNAAMKDSGVEWIGMIPDTWTIRRFKTCHTGTNVGESIDKEYISNDKECLVFYTAGLSEQYTTYNLFPEWKYTKKRDLLLSRNGNPYVFIPKEGALYSDHVIRTEILPSFDKKFLMYSLQTSILYEQAEGVSIVTWSAEIWNKQKIATPTLEIQKSIAKYLDEKSAIIDSLIMIKQKKIDNLNEYKKSLIYEYVTGKKVVVL